MIDVIGPPAGGVLSLLPALREVWHDGRRGRRWRRRWRRGSKFERDWGFPLSPDECE